MLSSGHYTASVDIWGAGCIFAEMQLSDPLFKGKNYIQQLKLIAKFLGTPSESDLQFVKKPRAKDFMQVQY
jgi:mitogen-activated protein kinase 1/3